MIIGSWFVEFLITKGIEVIALGRQPFDDIRESRREKIEGAFYLNLDMAEIKNWENCSTMGNRSGDDCVFFNLAWGGESGLSDLNVDAQLRNVTWCVDALEQVALERLR